MTLTKDEALRLWTEARQKCQVQDTLDLDAHVQCFAELVAHAEREYCAKLCEKMPKTISKDCDVWARMASRLIRANVAV